MNLKDVKTRVILAVRGVLPRFLPFRQRRVIELPWGASKLCFEDLRDFEFALGARTGVLPARLHELMQRSLTELQTELQGIRNLDQRIGAIVKPDADVTLPCGPAIAHLGVGVFSKDFEWRALFANLIELPAGSDRFLRSALGKYQQYLAARLSTVRLIMDMKALSAGASENAEDAHSTATMMFASDGVPRPFNRDELRRLPQGEAVTLRLARGSAISLKLARHQFSLTHNRDWTLIADNGKTYTLHEGVNCVGRGRDNDVSLDPDFRNVSRKHLLAQPLADDVIVLTDISSHGTYVPPTALAS